MPTRQFDVDRQFLVCVPYLGLGRIWLFYLWQEAIVMAADGGGVADDGGILFRRIGLADVPDLPGAHWSSLFFGETGLLRSR